MPRPDYGPLATAVRLMGFYMQKSQPIRALVLWSNLASG